MSFIPSRLKHVMRVANVATVATTMIGSFLGKGEPGASPLDAVSKVLFGNSEKGADTKDAAADVAGQAGAMYAWSAVLEGVFGKWVRRADGIGQSLGRAAVAGTSVSALAYLADTYVLPKSVAAGESSKRLSPLALATTYGVLAASLTVGAAWANRSGETA